MKRNLLSIGKHTYGWENLTIDVYRGSEARVEIGHYCSIAPDVRIITGGMHPTHWVSSFPFKARWNLTGRFEDGCPYTKGDVVIGNDVWICAGVTILSGVKVGHGSVIGASSVVTKDVPPYAIVAGNPACVIRFRFDDERIRELLDARWWDWSEDRIRKEVAPAEWKGWNTG